MPLTMSKPGTQATVSDIKGKDDTKRFLETLGLVAALAFLVFNLLCAPCFAAIGAIRREMNSAKWTWFAIGYQTTLAYIVALIINQVGGIIFGGLTFGIGTVTAVVLLIVMIFLLVRAVHKERGVKICCQQS